jgi:sarcosine oxidase subunit gamma
MVDMIEATRTQPNASFRRVQGSVSIEQSAFASRIALRAKEDAVGPLSTALGLVLPTRPKTSSVSGLRSALWLGPDEWLVIDQSGGDLMAVCATVDAIHSSADISHRNTAFIVSGEDAADVLNAGCPQDLSLAAFPVGAVSRTLFGKAEVVIFRVTEDTFRLECWRSFAEYVGGLLGEAVSEVIF